MRSSTKTLLSFLSLCSLSLAPALWLNANTLDRSAAVKPDALRPKQLVSIESPAPGELVSSSEVTLTVQLSRRADRNSIVAKVNGNVLTGSFQRTGSCNMNGCLYSTVITMTDGLQAGPNSIAIRVDSKEGSNSGSARVNFDWTTSPALETGLSSYLPTTIGLTTLHSGGGDSNGKNWIQIYSNAGAGTKTVYPRESDPVCPVFQVLDFDRKLLNLKSYTCYPDVTSFNKTLQSFDNTDLVIAGTGYGANAPAGLNTSAIGGTDYSDTNKYPSDLYPQGYMIVGSGGASAGQAYESYPNQSTTYSKNGALDYAAANGLLTRDGFNQYNFHPSDYIEYTVPLDPYITIGNAKYTMPDVNPNLGGFWVLLIDRISLQNASSCDGQMQGGVMVYAFKPVI